MPKGEEEQRKCKKKEEERNHNKKNHRETPGFQLVGGEIRCGIYWKDCPVLSVTERGEEEEAGGEEEGAAGLEGDEMRSTALASLPRQLISAELLEAGREKIRTGGSGFRKLLQHFHYEMSDLTSEFVSTAHTRLFTAGSSINKTHFTILDSGDVKIMLIRQCEGLRERSAFSGNLGIEEPYI